MDIVFLLILFKFLIGLSTKITDARSYRIINKQKFQVAFKKCLYSFGSVGNTWFGSLFSLIALAIFYSKTNGLAFSESKSFTV